MRGKSACIYPSQELNSKQSMKHILLALAVITSQLNFAQNTFRATIKDERTQEALTGATAHIQALNIGAATDTNGVLEIKNIPNGNFQIKFSYVGYKDFQKTFSFPHAILSMFK
jgi:iron complex outermembrane receptor protein